MLFKNSRKRIKKGDYRKINHTGTKGVNFDGSFHITVSGFGDAGFYENKGNGSRIKLTFIENVYFNVLVRKEKKRQDKEKENEFLVASSKFDNL